jgi:hypothetical protein
MTRRNVIRSVKFMILFFFQIYQELFQWMHLFTWAYLSSYSGHFWWSILHWIFIVPIVLFTFFLGVYNFGPKHLQRSLFNILLNPAPGIEFEGQIGESNEFDLLKHRRFNHNIVTQWITRSKCISIKRTTQS